MEDQFEGLPDKPEEDAQNTLKALWFAAKGSPKAVTHVENLPLDALTNTQVNTLESLIQKRLEGTPLAHLTGRQEFMNIELLADESALIPRKETEILGRLCLTTIKELSENESPIRVIDVCTGAGNLAIAFACHASNVEVYASDLSDEAVALAKRNVKHTNVDKRVTLYQGDFLEPFKTDIFLGKIDILCCNPPYISTGNVEKMHKEIHEHEPDLAFDGGPFGIKILTRLIKEAPLFLVPDGFICFEVGLGQGPAMIKRLTKSNQFQDIISANDEQDQIRAIRARFSP